jgi:putative ATP-dependent endonuclease of OLD family
METNDPGETEEASISPTAQAFMTTHSTIAISELYPNELYIVRNCKGTTEIQPIGQEVKMSVRATPEALLGRKILVCEGKTEVGLCRALDRWYATELHKYPFACLGVVPVTPTTGGGTKAPRLASQFASLGYQVGLLCDSDIRIDPSKADLEDRGVEVIMWDGNCAIEERVCLDLTWDSLQELLDIAIELKGESSVLDSICDRLELRPNSLSDTNLDSWITETLDEDGVPRVVENDIRTAIGEAAKNKDWFKSIDGSWRLGELIVEVLPRIQNTDLSNKLNQMLDWAYGV